MSIATKLLKTGSSLYDFEINIFLSEPETFLAPKDAKKASQKKTLKNLFTLMQHAYSMKIHWSSSTVKTTATSCKTQVKEKNEHNKLNCLCSLDYLNHPLFDSNKIPLVWTPVLSPFPSFGTCSLNNSLDYVFKYK